MRAFSLLSSLSNFSDEKIRKTLGWNMVPIGTNLAGTTNPIGTGNGRNWVKKGPESEILRNAPEFRSEFTTKSLSMYISMRA